MRDTILIVRLGAMGDVLHALAAVASLKKSFPGRKLVWLISHIWAPLVEGNPYVDELRFFDRSSLAELYRVWREVRELRPVLAVDLQGLVQSALAARASRPERLYGFDSDVAREPLASMLYTNRIQVTGPHRIERNLQLIAATGARELTRESWIPPGRPEGELPKREFVLASPFAGWGSKQWPLGHYEQLGRELETRGLQLVLNVPASREAEVKMLKNVQVHVSSISGLIDATRRATAVVGLDSGPLHLAAALKKPGAALFGPTDPAQTGPFEAPMIVLRRPHVKTTYKRGSQLDPSLAEISAIEVAEAVERSLRAAKPVAHAK
ncbi:MAG TPA: glycosyltransferase family 9 protein [Bryobacteraceae bacterium]|jgi:heptosyltransferase-1|nr:glycosyltransferase family 9 protein [Bryobacteraceae bacterium]